MDPSKKVAEAKRKKTETKGGDSGNGNGSLTKGRSFTAKDIVDLCVLVAYIVQARGQAAFDDVRDVIVENLNSKVHPGTLKKALRALQKKEMIAIEYAGGEHRYHMKRIKFNCSPEIAHVHKLIPTLKGDTAGIAIMAELSGEFGSKGTKEQDNKPENWVDYVVEFILVEPWLGAQVIDGNSYLTALYHAHANNNTFEDKGDPDLIPLLFERDPDGKSLVVHKGCVAGFIEKHLNRVGRSSYNVDWFDLEALRIVPGEGKLSTAFDSNGKICVTKYPIQAPNNRKGATGAGFGYYEALLPGQLVEWRFAAPTKNFLTPAEMEQWLRRILLRNRRTMSPARGTQTGAARLVKIEHTPWGA